MAVEVAVVGAGPAGLAAAGELGAAGFRVALIDEYPIPGGRLLGQRYHWKNLVWDGKQQAETLVDNVRQWHEVRWLLQRSVYDLERAPSGWALSLNPGDPSVVYAQAVVVATGATEVPIPLVNWTLPGVLAVGAAQVMTAVYGVAPGRRGVVVGANPLSFAIAEELLEAGVKLAGIVMAPGSENVDVVGSLDDQWQRIVGLRGGGAWPLRTLGRYMTHAWVRQFLMSHAPKSGVPIRGVRLRPNVVATAVEGTERVTGIRLARIADHDESIREGWSEPVDFVCVSGGLRPVPDLFRIARVKTAWVPELSGEVPVISPWGETSQTGLFAVGNAIGVESALVAIAQGHLGAHGVTRYLRGQSLDYRLAEPDQHRIQLAREQSPIAFHPKIGQGVEHLRALFLESLGAP